MDVIQRLGENLLIWKEKYLLKEGNQELINENIADIEWMLINILRTKEDNGVA